MKILLIAVAAMVLLTAGLYLWNRSLARDAEARFPPLGAFAEVEGLRLHYLVAGEGRPVVLLHGANGALQDFTATVFDRLAARYRVIAVDRPGHGYSERPADEVATPAVQARLVRGLLRRLGVDRPLLVGFSWSGSLVLRYALEHQDEVAGVVMLAGAAYEWPSPIDAKWRLPTWPVVGDLFVNTLSLVLGLRVADAGIEAAFAPEAVSASYADAPLPLALRPASFHANAEDVRTMKPVLRAQSKRYAELALPIVILVGDGDTVVSPSIHSRQLHAAAPGSELIVLPGAGHLLPYTRPDAVIDAIDRAITKTAMP